MESPKQERLIGQRQQPSPWQQTGKHPAKAASSESDYMTCAYNF